MTIFLVLLTLVAAAQSQARTIIVERKPFTDRNDRPLTLTEQTYGKATLGNCIGQVEYIPISDRGGQLKFTGVEECSKIAILDASGRISVPPEPTPSTYGEQCVSNDPAVCNMLGIRILDNDVRQETSIFLPAEFLQYAHTILVRSNSGKHLSLTAMPGKHEPAAVSLDLPMVKFNSYGEAPFLYVRPQLSR